MQKLTRSVIPSAARKRSSGGFENLTHRFSAHWLLVSRMSVSRLSALTVVTLMATGFSITPVAWGQASAQDYFRKALAAIDAGESAKAVELLGDAIKSDPQNASSYYYRGRENFRLGNIEQCVKDFDKYVELNPDVASRQWERGIALYYAGKFQAGADQFKLYQTFHDNDVENSVWRYLCMARADKDTTAARKAMLPIRNDRRVPMMQVYELYRGNLKPADVLEAIEEAGGSDAQKAGRTFYADLYLGLYYEANGKPKLARKHLDKAADPQLADSSFLNTYMWDVARIHVQLLDKSKQDEEVK